MEWNAKTIVTTEERWGPLLDRILVGLFASMGVVSFLMGDSFIYQMIKYDFYHLIPIPMKMGITI